METDAGTLEATRTFATRYRLRVRRDECDDPILPGRRGVHLYFDGPQLCLMSLDGPLRHPKRWQALEAQSLWIGATSRDEQRHGHQDVKAIGIPEPNWPLAIKLAGCKRRRQLTPEQAEAARTRLKRS